MKIGSIDKKVPIPDTSGMVGKKKYELDLAALDIGDSFILTADPGKKLPHAVNYVKRMAKKVNVTLLARKIDTTRARIWKVEDSKTKKGGQELGANDLREDDRGKEVVDGR